MGVCLQCCARSIAPTPGPSPEGEGRKTSGRSASHPFRHSRAGGNPSPDGTPTSAQRSAKTLETPLFQCRILSDLSLQMDHNPRAFPTTAAPLSHRCRVTVNQQSRACRAPVTCMARPCDAGAASQVLGGHYRPILPDDGVNFATVASIMARRPTTCPVATARRAAPTRRPGPPPAAARRPGRSSPPPAPPERRARCPATCRAYSRP